MKFIQGLHRHQQTLFPVSLDDAIDKDNEVRLIDLFVSALKLADFGFKTDFDENGRPAYHPADLLKLFIYGYLNKTRSSRDLEKECKRNIEVMWLMKGLTPDHNTISNFRKNNPKAIRKVFRATVEIARNFDLIGGKLIAGDSTKLRAQNSKKNNFNEKKIQRHLEYIENKIDQYTQQLSQADGDQIQQIQDQIKNHESRKMVYYGLREELERTGEVQISTSDPDSRQLITRNNITEVAYNIQTTVDEKHNLLLDYKVTNENDSKAMGDMVQRASDIVQNTDFTALFDKGYHTGSELKIAQELGVETLVAIPDISSASMAPDHAYNVSEFQFDLEQNTYTCPQGQSLSTNGTWYKKDRNGPGRKATAPIRVQHYKTSACKTCPAASSCTRNTSGRGRVIERSEFAPNIEKNRKNMEQKEQLYRRRQAIVEHPYGIIKRQWGFYYISTKKGMEPASADVGLIFVAYNLRRLFNILGKERLAALLATFLTILNSILSPYNPFKAKTTFRIAISKFLYLAQRITFNKFQFQNIRLVEGGF